MKFIGRTKELDSLELLLKKKSSSLVVIRGRMRECFAKYKYPLAKRLGVTRRQMR